jgi:lysozyme
MPNTTTKNGDPITFAYQLKSEEGVEHQAYPDPLTNGPPWTIGVGHTGPEVKPGLVWTDEQIDEALAKDIEKHNRGVLRELPWVTSMNEPRQAVVFGMAFQMGVDGLLGFRNTLAKMQKRDYYGAAHGMRQSKWFKQTSARAERMAKQMETGEWHLKPGF